ncbi:hypothetical protein EYF80_028289 [Liparis tanakae]|uniref:Uncharacterized protein n=1 Tax=Liparis tanakae TaxID=230148 RepID=A0A4Z2H9J7_9TELE|nr:hypothetical protein EYF80_028289 [Liparis tanakae]
MESYKKRFITPGATEKKKSTRYTSVCRRTHNTPSARGAGHTTARHALTEATFGDIAQKARPQENKRERRSPWRSDAVHLLRGDLVDGDHPAVAAQAVGHLPVVEAAVLERVDAQLAEAHAHVHVLQVQQPRVQRSLVYELGHVGREDVAGAGAEGRPVKYRLLALVVGFRRLKMRFSMLTKISLSDLSTYCALGQKVATQRMPISVLSVRLWYESMKSSTTTSWKIWLSCSTIWLRTSSVLRPSRKSVITRTSGKVLSSPHVSRMACRASNSLCVVLIRMTRKGGSASHFLASLTR